MATTTGRTNRTPKKKAAPRKRTAADWAPRFLVLLSETANVRAACRAAKVGRRTVYDRRDSDLGFGQAMAEALEEATDDLELEARRRAVDGVERSVFYQGLECGTVTEYSDTLLIFLLKAHRPEKFRERHDVRHTGTAPGGAIAHEVVGEITHDLAADLAPYAQVLGDLAAGLLGGPAAETLPPLSPTLAVDPLPAHTTPGSLPAGRAP